MKIDYLIVGAGLAGLSFARFCELNNKSYLIIDHGEHSSSMVAGGMFNPVVLKRFTSIWKSKEQLELAFDFYPKLEEKLKTKFFYPMSIYRKFATIEEQNDWFVACDKPDLSEFLATDLVFDDLKGIPNTLGFGKVHSSGFLNVAEFVSSYKKAIQSKGFFMDSTFDYDKLGIENESIFYREIQSKHLVFAQGFSMNSNPFFSNLPLDGTKGELLLIRIPELKLKSIVKSGIFVVPYKDDLYKVGATYNWQDKTYATTSQAKKELLAGLEKLIDTYYEVIEHKAGIRPTVKDRRPLVGTHFEFKNVHLLNGLGTRGVLLGPYLAKALFENLEKNSALDPEISINRYYKKMQLL